MSWNVRPCASVQEQREAMSAIWHYFGRSAPRDDQMASLAALMPVERMYGVRDAGRVVGGAGAFPFQLTVPGGRVPAAGVSVVGVLPTHRRRGVLTAMMRAQLDACRVGGEPVAYLWASEDRIYGRFGYGLASLTGEIELARDRSAFDASFEPFGRARLVPLTEAEPLVAAVWAAVAEQTPGMFARTPAWWQTRTLADPDWRRGGGGELQCVVFEAEGRPAAYALYRINLAFDRGVSTSSVIVVEAMGDSPPATRAVWRYLLDMDWVARARAGLLPLDHPLFLLVAEPRQLRFSVRDGVWVRLVDVGAALSARAYAGPGSVVVDVADAFCPWNTGRWRVGEGGVEHTATAPDLRCDVAALGSVYLGGFTWAQLARALRVEEARPGAIASADALFRSARAPWCPEIF
ncbi:MAG TPA: GNAT family N-acetyltransferase [Methylomirabilota bacterium]|nr:GNAT family N-acetyltransferase [Methylomirabilota bacterium]